MLERLFKLSENDTDVRREIMGGVTTFLTMCYIIFVNPVFLEKAGMNKDAVMVATCLSSAIATLCMAFLANYPIALAPGMGHNALFAFTICGAVTVGGFGLSWRAALAMVFISGALFIILSNVGFREALIDAIPESLKHGIAVGIGLLIAMVGLQWAGIVVDNPGTLVGLGNLRALPTMVAIFGVTVTAILMTLGVRGAIFFGILATAAVGLISGVTKYHGVISLPPSLSPTFFKLSFAELPFGKFADLLVIVFVLFFLDVFDTVGTLIGVSVQAGLLKNGKLARARQALLSDAIGTVAGAVLGTSTVTSYIESAAGVAVGARTGLASVVTAVLFLLALFFRPVMEMVSAEVPMGNMVLHPIIAPALIIVGYLMMRSVQFIKWDDVTNALPAFLAIMIMPVTFSITEGIAFAFIAYSALKIVSGRAKEVHWLVHL
ncbi:MAG TPA: NCS2 family permease, partial [Armatimonadetes bacterium]|nr:NCS2 family permease [Armatimonadota bacterium]